MAMSAPVSQVLTNPAGARGKPAAPASRVPKYTLASVTQTTKPDAVRALIYGVEKVGKSSWANGAPDAIWIPLENGTGKLTPKPKAFPKPETFDDVLGMIRAVEEEESAYRTLVIDPITWLEPMIWDALCRENSWKDIEAPGYGKGYTAAVDKWRQFIAALERVWMKGINVILVGHSATKTIKNPEGEDWDRYVVPIHEKAFALIQQWVDAILFAQFERSVRRAGNATKGKAFETGERLLRTESAGAYAAGNRYSLPDPMRLEAGDFWAGVDAFEHARSPEGLRERARELANQMAASDAALVEQSITKIGDDCGRLQELCHRIEKRLAAQTEVAQ